MIGLQPGRRIIALVWGLVLVGLLAGVVTNGLTGWTLYELNQQRRQLAEEEAQLNRGAAQLRQLSRRTQQAFSGLLQLEVFEAGEDFPLAELNQLHDELQNSFWAEELAGFEKDLNVSISNLQQIWRRAQRWRDNYRPVLYDDQGQQSLLRVRQDLQQLRAEIEIFEGRQRLDEALSLRRWREATSTQKTSLANNLLSSRQQLWRRSLNAVNSELADLSRLVEILAAEERLDQLADLRDNQIKPSLERLEQELQRLRGAGNLEPQEMSAPTLNAFKEGLFGVGYSVYEEYQTIHPGRGGLYRLAEDRLTLMRQRAGMQGEVLRELTRLEALYPVLAGLTEERNRELAQSAEVSLSQGALDLFLLSLLTFAGFLSLGGLITKMTGEQLRTMAQLRRQNEQILASAGEGVIGVNQQKQMTFINPAAAELLGRKADECKGVDYAILLKNSTERRAHDFIAETLACGTSYRSDEEFLWRADNSRMPVSCVVTPMHDHQQQVEGAVLTFTDITARKAAEKTLRRYYDRLAEQDKALAELNRDLEQKVVERTRLLEEKNQQLVRTEAELAHAEKLAAIGSLAAGVAHEINNPAAIIRGNAEILQGLMADQVEGRDETAEILDQIERISLITSNLLDFARKQDLRKGHFNLNQMLKETLAQLRHQVPAPAVNICFEPQAELPACFGDADRLRQVFTNLLVNALQAMPAGGRLRVASCRHNHYVQIDIQDEGMGMSEDVRSQIFHPFFTTKKTGTGLGLPVSYGIVQAHEGLIEVESQPGKGSLFRVSLPISLAKSDSPQKQPCAET